MVHALTCDQDNDHHLVLGIHLVPDHHISLLGVVLCHLWAIAENPIPVVKAVVVYHHIGVLCNSLLSLCDLYNLDLVTDLFYIHREIEDLVEDNMAHGEVDIQVALV
jgi:hypothetical protein